jgi:membrane-associated phospholipid phosphatase
MNLLSVIAGAIVAAAASGLASACGASSSAANADDCRAGVLVAWNERVLLVAEAEDKFLTLKGVRAVAMMHLAMHDAINSIHRHYAAYAFEGDGGGADPVAAAAQAAYEIAVSEYPNKKASWDKELRGWLDAGAGGRSKQKAIELGKKSAAAILERRAGDGWNDETEYRWHPMAPGVYAEFHEHSGTPEGFVFGAGWASVKPFALRSQKRFRALPPPAIESDEYTRAYNEVKEVGRFESRSRTQDQTHLALWWKEFVESSHNRLARRIVAASGADLWSAARMLALLNLSIVDAYISSFDSKFFYNHWRPFTAIRWAAHDGNPRTEPDLQWNNTHRHTYAFPSYPSAHGAACGAAMTVLSNAFGDDYPFTMEIREVDSAGPMSPKMRMDPPTRSFESFSAAAVECALSRVYLGIHFRYDSIEGNRQGRQIGAFVTESLLAPLR